MTREDLERQLRESGTLIERLQECRERIGKMCKEGRPPKMTIPVQWYDDDFFISTTLRDAITSQQMYEPCYEPDDELCWCSQPSPESGYCKFCGAHKNT